MFQIVLRGLLLCFLQSISNADTRAQAFDCGRKYCKDMSSCSEADYKFRVCNHRQLDADNDGIPCENICGDNTAIYLQRRANGGIISQSKGDQPRSAQNVNPDGSPLPIGNNFACGTKRTCREMISCDEAKFHFEKCGLAKLDGDRDGIPCNSICR